MEKGRPLNIEVEDSYVRRKKEGKHKCTNVQNTMAA